MEDTYEWWTYATMVRELGADLASDLKQRHESADPRHTGRFIKEHLGGNVRYFYIYYLDTLVLFKADIFHSSFMMTSEFESEEP